MSLTFMTSHSMVAVSHDMLTDPEKLQILDGHALLKELLKQIRGTHDELSALTTAEGILRERLQEITEELRVCDQVHDRLTRGMYRSLEAAADLKPTAEEARVFTDALNLLFPAGLSINALPFREQSGNVLKVAKQFTAPVRALFETIIIGGHTLADSFDAWVKNGEQMGQLVAERVKLTGVEDDTRVSDGDLRDLRNRWGRVMNILISTLDLVGLPDADRRHLLSNLRDAEAAAVRTRASEQPANKQTTPTENTTEDTPQNTETKPNHEAEPTNNAPQTTATTPVAEDL